VSDTPKKAVRYGGNGRFASITGNELEHERFRIGGP
jgi:hypothetical protein